MTNSRFPFPKYPHVPGQNQRHEEGFADPIINTLPGVVSSSDGIPAAFHHSLVLMKNGYYWEAHEVLEAIWLRTPRNSREYFFVQGVIHLTNGALKIVMARKNAASRLKKMAIECFDRSFRGEKNLVLFGMERSGIQNFIDEYLHEL